MSVHLAFVRDAELLSVTAGTVSGRPRVFLTLRLDPIGSFESTTLSVSPEQARRLVNDLTERFGESKVLSSVESPGDDAKMI